MLATVSFYFKNKPLAIALLLSFLLSGLVAQIIKNLVTSPRPRLFFKPGQYSHFIDGVSLANNSSFPSGHTATAFALSAVLAIMIKNKNWHLFFLFVAATVGYSRIYLAQHFLLDVLIAAVIGTLSGIAAVVITKNRMDARLAIHKEQTMNNDKPLISPSTAQAV
jgi:membrane-associated phospholipid phosphatase